MARTKAVLGSGARLCDYLGASLLARVFPLDAVQACLDRHGRSSQRVRSFPATVGVYYCMALSLYPEAAYSEVFDVLTDASAWSRGERLGERVGGGIAKSSVSALRTKIGWEPLRDLLDTHCLPLARIESHPDAFFAGLRLVAMDGSNFELPDERRNVSAFGYPGSRTGHAGYPQAQCAILVECATHAVLAAHIDAYATDEFKVCQAMFAKLDGSMLCLADRGFRGHGRWVAARATGAQLLWRSSTQQEFAVERWLEDGSYLSTFIPSKGTLAERQAKGVLVRIIDYTITDRQGTPSTYRLMTSLLTLEQGSAQALAELYHQRWQVESVFDELKTHQLQSRRVLRSKTPDLVRQEFYGWVLAHYAVRWLLDQGASAHKQLHANLSFKGHLQILRQAQPQSGAFPP